MFIPRRCSDLDRALPGDPDNCESRLPWCHWKNKPDMSGQAKASPRKGSKLFHGIAGPWKKEIFGGVMR